MAVSLARGLLPQMSLPSMIPTEITQLGLYGVLGGTVLEILFVLSYTEMLILYCSWSLAFLITVNGITDATRYH